MIKINIPFDFAYDGYRVVELKSGETLPDDDPAALYAVDEGFGEKCADVVEEKEEATAEALPKWPLQTDPEVYLEKTPNGPKADLARQILGL